MLPKKREWTGARITPDFVEKWSDLLFDVCGVGASRSTKVERNSFITHTHNDHLPLPAVLAPQVKLFVAPPLVDVMHRIYGNTVTIEEHADFIETKHTLIVNNRVTAVPAYGYFIRDAIVVPESDQAAALIAEYKVKYRLVFVHKQPRAHFGQPFDNSRDDVFILDVSAWSPYRPNVVPKLTFSRADREQYEQFVRTADPNRSKLAYPYRQNQF